MKTLLQLAPISAQTGTDPGPDWRTQASCLDRDPELFFPHPSDRDGEDAAVAVCWQCPVEADCLADAMEVEKGLSASSRWGIWGGYGPVERVMLERMRARLTAPFWEEWMLWDKESEHLPGDWESAVAGWLAAGLTMPQLIEALDIALSKRHVKAREVFRYTGGIVRNWIADLDRLTAEELAKGAGNGEN